MLTVIQPVFEDEERRARMQSVLDAALAGKEYRVIATAEELDKSDLRNTAVLFAICLSKQGINYEYYRMLQVIRTNRLAGRFAGSLGGILIDGAGELYTRAIARELAFAANRAGMAFPGKALVEGTGSLYNFETISMLLQKDNLEAYGIQTANLVDKLEKGVDWMHFDRKILVVHAGSRKTSNSLMIFDKVKGQMEQICEEEGKPFPEFTEVALQNGQVIDCRGCPYDACLHFGENKRCFYGDIIVEEVYPALLDADSILLVCPNYNDAVSANIMAFINRLTAIFRANDFSGKRVYAIVVSGYSGGDLVAQQILGAMNFNKNMILPPDFALIETANTPGSVLNLSGIDVRARAFARRVLGLPREA